jgi:CRISPR/Cas system-associated exonuclease Cas4 (RecB family)
LKKKKTLRRIDTPHGRAYVLEGDGEIKFLPSVTSVLSLKSSAYLTDLEEKIGKEELQKISERAALRGTAMHKFLENYLVCMKHQGDPDSCLLYTQRKSTDSLLHDMDKERVDTGRSLFYNIYHSGVLDNIKKVIFTEKFLHSEINLFAGTTDFGYLDGNNYIVITDFKSASSPRGEEIIDKYKCQAAAYAIAFEEMYKKPVQRGEIWISHPDGLQIEEVAGQEMIQKKEEFIELCKKYHLMWDIAPFIEFLKNDI